MKKYNFNLQKILEYNKHIQKKEQDVLAEMKYEYITMNDEYRKTEDGYKYTAVRLGEEVSAGMKLSDYITENIYIKQYSEQMIDIKNRMSDKEKEIDIQVNRLVAVSKEKTILEKLNEKQLREYMSVFRKYEENLIDEFVSAKTGIERTEIQI